jgi:hypothetical protein
MRAATSRTAGRPYASSRFSAYLPSFWVSGFGYGVSGFGFRISGMGIRASGFGYVLPDFWCESCLPGFLVSGFEFWVSVF